MPEINFNSLEENINDHRKIENETLRKENEFLRSKNDILTKKNEILETKVRTMNEIISDMLEQFKYYRVYLNEILQCRVKLDVAQVMKNSMEKVIDVFESKINSR